MNWLEIADSAVLVWLLKMMLRIEPWASQTTIERGLIALYVGLDLSVMPSEAKVQWALKGFIWSSLFWQARRDNPGRFALALSGAWLRLLALGFSSVFTIEFVADLVTREDWLYGLDRLLSSWTYVVLLYLASLPRPPKRKNEAEERDQSWLERLGWKPEPTGGAA